MSSYLTYQPPSFDDFTAIKPWMGNKGSAPEFARLTRSERTVYAFIYRFSQDKKHMFYGNVEQICDYLELRKSTVYNALRTLITSGLIDEINKNKKRFLVANLTIANKAIKTYKTWREKVCMEIAMRIKTEKVRTKLAVKSINHRLKACKNDDVNISQKSKNGIPYRPRSDGDSNISNIANQSFTKSCPELSLRGL